MAKTPADQVKTGFRIAFGRAPSAAEAQVLVPLAEQQGLPSLCRVLFNSNEFFFVD
jgi:hypothetical protein